MTTGTVKWFNAAKGYGFITPESGEKDVFVHSSSIQDRPERGLAEGDRVEFDSEDSTKGPQATKVRFA